MTVAACSGLESPAATSFPDVPASTIEPVGVTASASDDSEVPSTESEEWFQISFSAAGYQCQDAIAGFQQYDCYEAPGGEPPSVTIQPDLYCSGSETLPDCSELWYPSELDQYRLVEFDGVSYLCEQNDDSCVEYAGGPTPASSGSPDVWCDNVHCTYFDLDRYFEVSYGGQMYICERGGLFGYNCYRPIGNTLPIAYQPDLYCSGSEFSPRCSDLWYPDDLDRYQLIESGGSTYLCEDAVGGSFGDYDCGQYTGGDPSLVYTGGLKCSSSFGSFDCDTEFYPSELEGLYFLTIEFREYVCRDTIQGSECFPYSGGSPRSATMGLPDFYCNRSGECSDDYYP